MGQINEIYSKGYMDGCTAAMERVKEQENVPCIDLEGIMERYGVGKSTAYMILRGIRHVCNGGKLGLTTKVLKAEVLYWESIVDKQYLERL